MHHPIKIINRIWSVTLMDGLTCGKFEDDGWLQGSNSNLFCDRYKFEKDLYQTMYS